jgi:hypothetical protein
MKTWFAIGLILAFAVVSAETPLRGQDNTESLQKEVADLKREVELLKRERDLLTRELTILKADSQAAKGKKSVPADDEINGVLWEIIGLSPEGKPIGPPGRFHALQGKVFVEGKEVGTYADRGATTTVDVTGMPEDRVNGRYQFQRIDKNTYRGTMRNLLGKEHKVVLRLVKD